MDSVERGIRRTTIKRGEQGPRSTPTVDDDQVFVLSDIGVLASLEKDTGKSAMENRPRERSRWQNPLLGLQRFSPLVDGNASCCHSLVKKSSFSLWIASLAKQLWDSQGYNEPGPNTFL